MESTCTYPNCTAVFPRGRGRYPQKFCPLHRSPQSGQKVDTKKLGRGIFAIGTILLLVLIILGAVRVLNAPALGAEFRVRTLLPKPPALEYSILRTGPLEVAKVFGKTQGCQDAPADFIYDVSSAANRVELDPRLVAATIAVESSCNQFVISNKGAVGFMQVRVSAWKDKYDFSSVNLLNRADNLRVGTEILSGLIKEFGVASGVERYQGLGPGGDGFYVQKILTLAGRK